MSKDLEQQIQELQAENNLLRQQLEQKSKLAARALASYQQRALQMEIIRQQNEELDQLAASLAQAKQTAEEQAAILESFIENSPVMIFIKEAKELSFVRWNKANENLLGFKGEDVVGKSDYDFFPKEVADFFVAKDREVLAAGQLLDIPEEPIQTASGEIRFLHTRKVPIYGADGTPKYLMGVAEDITERKRVEATLRENEQRYRQILDAITDMVLVKGPQSRIVWANRAFRDCYGMTNEQLRDLVDADFVEPDYTQQYIKDDAYVFNSGQVLNIPEEPVTRYDGQILTMHTVKSPLFDVDGQVVGTVGVSRDITERKAIEAALAKRAAELQTVAQVSIAASTTLDVRKLLQEVVDLTKSSFSLYHAHIYLLSETGNTLHLVSGAGEVGRQMVTQGWSISAEREQSLVAQAARTRQGVIVNDVRLNPDFLPNPLLPLTHSEMAVPMIVGNRVLGVLDVQSDKVNHFTEEDIRIQTILAAQIAVALQNAQQYGQTEAALAETAWLYQISTQLSAATNIKELFDATVTPAIASGATNASLMVFQLGTTGQPEWAEVVETLETEPKFPAGTQIYLPESPLSQLPFSDIEKVLLVGDTAQDERLDLALKAMLLESQTAAGVMMMLTVGQRHIGQIIIGWDTPQLFTESDQRLYDSIATQAATIFDNLRLSEQTERALAEVETLYNASTEVIQAKTIDEALAALVYNSAFERFDRVTLLFFNRAWTHERPQFMTPVALWERENEHPVIAPGTHYPLEQFPVITLFSADQPTILTDIAADERTDENTRMLLVEELGMHSLVVFPLVVGGQWLGVITGQGYTTLSLSEAEIRQLKSLTDQAATVIQTQRLFEQTQQTLDLTERLFEAGRRLNTAADLQAAIAAVVESSPLREINRAVLLLFERDEAGEVEAGVVAANWYSGSGTPPTAMGTRYAWKIMGTLKFALSNEAVFFSDTHTDSRVDSFALEVFERQNIRALAALPLWVGSRQLGVLLLEAEEIHHFTTDEIQPYTALAGQLAIVIDRQNLLEQTRAALAEARILYQTSRALVLADSLDEILEAIASAEIAPDLSGVSLLTTEVDEGGQPEWATIAANWSAGPVEAAVATPIGTRFYLPDFPLSQLWISTPQSITLIGDVYRHERVNPVLEAIFRQVNITALALMPLFIRGEWLGLISLTWATPQTFTERHQRLFNSLALQASVTVNNQLLLERTQADLVEQERLTADLDNQRSTLQAVLQSIPAGVFVVEAPTGRPLLTNQQAQELLGRGISPEAGKEELAEVYSAYRYGTDELYPPQEMPLVRGMSGEVTTVDDMEIRRPDGKNILLQVFGGPIRDASGQITASVAIFQDVTEQRRTAQEREQLLAEVQAAYRQFVQREWDQFLGESHGGRWSVEHQEVGAVVEGNGKLRVLEDEVTRAGQLKAISAVEDQAVKPAIVAPISLRGQVIGTLSLQDIDPNRHWTAEEMALVETVSEQLAQTVENLRLFEETQKRATREQLTRAITDKMRALPDIDSIIQTGLAELAQTLDVPRTYVKLASKPEQIADVSQEIDSIRSQLKQQGHR